MFVVALSTFSQLRRVTLAYENMKRIVFESTAWRDECGAACSDEIHAIKNCFGRERSDNELLRSEKGPQVAADLKISIGSLSSRRLPYRGRAGAR